MGQRNLWIIFVYEKKKKENKVWIITSKKHNSHCSSFLLAHPTQCAAVITQSLLIIEPPQLCSDLFCNETCQGISSIGTTVPPTIR